MSFQKKYYFINLNFDNEQLIINSDEINLSFKNNKSNILIPYLKEKNLISNYDIKKEAWIILSSLKEKSEKISSKFSLLVSPANPEIFASVEDMNLICVEVILDLVEYYKKYLINQDIEYFDINIENEANLKEFFEDKIDDNKLINIFIFYNITSLSLNRIIQFMPEKEPIIYFNPVLKTIDQYKKIETDCYENLRKKAININTAKRFSRDWTKNFLKNSMHYAINKGVSPLINILEGKIPVTVIGAGSSVDEKLDILKSLSEISIMICVDTALIPLTKAGVNIDYVVSSDSQSINSLYITHSDILKENNKNNKENIERNNPFLVCLPIIYPKLINKYKGKIAFSSIPFALVKDIDSFSEHKIEIGSGGTVSALAFELAVLLNPSEIFLVGTDFCYSYGKLHCQNSLFDTIFYNKIGYLRNYESFIIKSMLKAHSFLVINDYGFKSRTDPKFLMFLDWFKAHINTLERKNKIYYLSNRSYGLSFIKYKNNDEILTYINNTDDSNKKLKSEIVKKIKSINFEDKNKSLILTKYKEYLNKIKIEGLSAKSMILSVLKRIENDKDRENEFKIDNKKDNFIEVESKIEQNKNLVEQNIYMFLNMLEKNLLNFEKLKTLINMSFQDYLLSIQFENKEIDTISFYKNLLNQLDSILKEISGLINIDEINV